MGTWVQWLAFIMGRCAEAAAVIGVISAIVALSSYRKSVRDTNRDEEAKRMEASIRVLQIFSDTFVPQAETYRSRFEREYQRRMQETDEKLRTRKSSHGASTVNASLNEQIIRNAQIDMGIIKLFNKLEQICVYIKNDLVREDIVYPAIHAELLQFIDDNRLSFDLLTTPDTAFENLHFTVEKW